MTVADQELDSDRVLARQLRRSWDPFFGRFGRLTSVQRATIPAILAGESVLVCAPTAAGKTEAACAPLVEQRVGRSEAWTVLYISPTRALVNDLHARLCGPVEQLGLRIARRTGDHRDVLNNSPHVLITTPESFDSLLCRGRREGGHVLSHVDAVVLDEIHLLHASARGEQIRWLLERLRRLRQYARAQGWTHSQSVQIVALSATVSDPEGVRSAYLPEGRLIHLAGGREIETVVPDCNSPSVETALPAYVDTLVTPEKILVFSNARRRVDDLAMRMRPALEARRYVVRAHHGSLAQGQRESTEVAAKSEQAIVLFATSTLEIGIDIGDIDLVVLDGPAPDVPALLQRIGRGNRRTQRTRVMACAGSLAEVLIQSAMLTAARDSYLGPSERGTYYAVIRQQLASYIFQAPRTSRLRGNLENLVASCAPELEPVSLIRHLISTGELQADAGGVGLGPGWTDATAKGDIHSNIEARGGNSVVDESSGDTLAVGVDYRGGPRLSIAGHLLDVKSWRDRRIEVRQAKDSGGALGDWSYTSKAWVQGAGQPQTVRRYLGLAADVWPVLPNAGGGMAVFHFGGARRKALLKLLLSRMPATSGVKVDNWILRLPGSRPTKPAWLMDVGPGIIDVLIAGHLEALENALGLPSANKHLPLEVRAAEVRSWLNVEQQLEAVQSSVWATVADPDLSEALHVLRQGL